MKKVLSVLIICCSLFSAFSAKKPSEAEKRFVRGSIADKIDVVSSATGKDAYDMSVKGLEYSLSNVNLLGPDSELNSLVAASVLTLKNQDLSFLDEVSNKNLADTLIKAFEIFHNDSVQIGIIDCLSKMDNPKWNGTVQLLNNYLQKHFVEMYPSNILTGNIIAALGNFGDSKSFSLVYNIWITNQWPEYKSVAEISLVKLAQNSMDDTTKLIFFSDNSIISSFLQIVKKTEEIDSNFKANLAETALSFAINNAESLQDFSSAFVSIQMDTLRILSLSKWAHACPVVIRNFEIAKKEYSLGLISDSQFIEIMDYTKSFTSPEVSSQFSNLLAEFNGRVEKTDLPSEPVVLALINNLGELGDKAAFDNLLYVTYLGYSERVINAAKNSLALLKW